ncbi:hypothetical protein Tco_1578197 [Tanacetum coccineum]
MHNDIIAAGSKERPPMLAPDSYAQWKSRFMRYVDTKPNRELLKKTIYEGPYIMTKITHPETPKDGDRKVERLQQGESINIQDVETKLFWEFGIFTSRDRESIESYYTRFATIVMQANILDNVSYHTLFDILKQHQNEVNEIYAERIARNANPLTLVAATQNYPDDYCKAHLTPKPFKPHTPSQHQPDQMLLPSTKNEDTSPTTRNDRNTKQFGNQRTVAVVGNKKTVGNQAVQQSGI